EEAPGSSPSGPHWRLSGAGRRNRGTGSGTAVRWYPGMATKSAEVAAMDVIQRGVRPLLKEAGFRGSGRTFNRGTPDGLTQVVRFQMGSFDPPGTTDIPGLRENRYGWFTVNLGVYVPEVAKHHGGGEAGKVA